MGGRPCAHSPESRSRVTASRLPGQSQRHRLPAPDAEAGDFWNHSLASGKNQEPSLLRLWGLTQVQSLANHRVSESKLLFLIQMFPFLF